MSKWRFPITLAVIVLAFATLALRAVAQTSVPSPSTLFDFTSGTTAQGTLAIGGDGVLYGTAVFGGTGSCITSQSTSCGTVFSLTPPASAGGAWTETVLHNFTGEDGAFPYAGVAIGSGPGGIPILYGTTRSGGGTDSCDYPLDYNFNFGCGVVYSLTPGADGTWNYATLHAFNGSDGSSPAGSLAIGSGPGGEVVLYGTASGGGTGSCPTGIGETGCGTIFSLTASAPGGSWTFSVLHNFGFAEGSMPLAGVTLGSTPGGRTVLYGGTVFGGYAPQASFPGGPVPCNSAGPPDGRVDLGCGTIFALTRTSEGGSWTLTVLYYFDGGADGGSPSQPLVIGGSSANPVFYGTTPGSVFSLTGPPSAAGLWNLTVLRNSVQPAPVVSNLPPDNGWVSNSVVMANDGTLYGTDQFGGLYSCSIGCGTIYSLTPAGGAWTVNVLHKFTGNDGESPNDVVLGSGPDGSSALYGTTGAGGGGGSGTVFSFVVAPDLHVAPGGVVNAADYVASVRARQHCHGIRQFPPSGSGRGCGVAGPHECLGAVAPICRHIGAAIVRFRRAGEHSGALGTGWRIAGLDSSHAERRNQCRPTREPGAYSPAIFTRNAQGSGQGMILDLSYNLVDSLHPASAGSYIQIFCTGLGAISHQPPTGFPAPLEPLSWTASTVTATWRATRHRDILRTCAGLRRPVPGKCASAGGACGERFDTGGSVRRRRSIEYGYDCHAVTAEILLHTQRADRIDGSGPVRRHKSGHQRARRQNRSRQNQDRRI